MKKCPKGHCIICPNLPREPKPLCISVCKNTILSNLKNGTDKPVIRVSEGLHGRPRRQRTLDIRNPKRVQFKRGRAPWGARVWVEITR